MGKKSTKRKAQKHFLVPTSIRQARRGPPPDFDEIQRQAERHAARHEELRYRIAEDCKVHIQFNGIATQSAIRKLISYLEISVGDFPKESDTSAPR